MNKRDIINSINDEWETVNNLKTKLEVYSFEELDEKELVINKSLTISNEAIENLTFKLDIIKELISEVETKGVNKLTIESLLELNPDALPEEFPLSSFTKEPSRVNIGFANEALSELFNTISDSETKLVLEVNELTEKQKDLETLKVIL